MVQAQDEWKSFKRLDLFRFGIEVTKTTEAAKKQNSKLKQQGIMQGQIL